MSLIRVVLLTMAGAAGALAQQQELGLTLGGLAPSSRSGTALDLSGGLALQANYGYRLAGGQNAALYFETHFLANAQRTVESQNRVVTRDVATIFITPGLRVKLLPQRRVSPYAAIGGGYALFEQSTTTLAGAPNPAPRETSQGAFDFGGGVDAKLWRFVSLRAEVRDFYTGNPSFNAPVSGRQHNVVAGGGFVLRFGQ